MFLPRLNEISGGCEKIVPVSESFRSNLKFFKNDRFNCVVVRVNGPPSSIIHHTSRTPYLFHSFSDFVVYVVTTLIFRKNRRQSASFSINVAILSLSFKRATTAPNKLIDSQHYKRLRRITLTKFRLINDN